MKIAMMMPAGYLSRDHGAGGMMRHLLMFLVIVLHNQILLSNHQDLRFLDRIPKYLDEGHCAIWSRHSKLLKLKSVFMMS